MELGVDLIDKIVRICLQTYDKLPKTGKPTLEEWTVLSCIVQFDYKKEDIEVISLGTGSKCIGARKMSGSGDILNDSHAEVIARRGFLLYLYNCIDRAIEDKPSIFIKQSGKFKLKDNFKFIFYSSQLPCGDASIIPKSENDELIGDLLKLNKRQSDGNNCNSVCKRSKLKGLDDIYRTGAKCLPYSEQDLKVPGIHYHKIGQVRTKPGRGDKTLSVSCSDKLAKWVHLGIQGSLLEILLCYPVFISHFIFGASVPYSEDSLTRALLKRNPAYVPELSVVPLFHQSSLSFSCNRTEQRIRPSPCSIVWVRCTKEYQEVAVQGRRLGVTKKKLNPLMDSLCICKFKVYEKFVEILHKDQILKYKLIGESDIKNITYNEMKMKSKSYVERWKVLKERFFTMWTVKPDIWNFYVNVM